jgi:hypothetical protein
MTVTERQMETIRASLDERRLLERAMLDAIEAFSKFAVHRRTPHEALVILEGWRDVFERNYERRRR